MHLKKFIPILQNPFYRLSKLIYVRREMLPSLNWVSITFNSFFSQLLLLRAIFLQNGITT